MKKSTDFFEKMTRNKSFIRGKSGFQPVFFQLDFDENGAFIRVVNKSRKEIEVEYEYFQGHTRDLLKAIERIKERNSFRIDWEVPENRIYLGENEYLIWQLQQCDNFVDENLKQIRFATDKARVVALIEEQKSGLLKTSIRLSYKKKMLRNIQFLNENHVYGDGKVYRIDPLSENFKMTGHFETELLAADIEKYLSLLFSCFNTISIKYGDYKIIEGAPKITRPSLIFEKVDPDNSLFFRVSASLPGFDADFFESFDVSKIVMLNDLEKTVLVREVVHEDMYVWFNDIVKLLKKHKKKLTDKNSFYTEDNLFIVEEFLAREFLFNELTGLVAGFDLFGAEKLKNYKVAAVKPRLDLNLSHGIDFLEGEANIEIEGERFSLFDALNQYRKNAYIVLKDGTHAVINKDYINKLRRLFKKDKKKVRVSFFDLPMVDELIDEKVAEGSLQISRDIFLGFNRLNRLKPKYPDVNAKLRNYQKQGYKWLNYLHKHSLGGCLADDMGLGKTLQAITFLSSVYPGQKKCSLIIMPRSILFNWAAEIDRFQPALTYYTYHGQHRDFKEAKTKNLILTTYATVRNDVEMLKDEEFYYILLDESQNIKNLNSQTTRAVMLLNSAHRLALSGTPIENNLGELYSLFRFLNPSMFSSAERFNKDYVSPIQKDNDQFVLKELKKKIYPFILRRLKNDVLEDLPDKIEQILYVDMSPEQELFYEERRKFYYNTVKKEIGQNGIAKSQFFILQALGELRQIASVPESKSDNRIISPKREPLMEGIIDVTANGHKVLVFANYLNAIDTVSQDLNSAGLDYLVMTGSTRDRQSLVERFQDDEACRVFLMSLKTGGIGLNLTAADYVFIFDPWWNVAVENQAVDRSHRIGQERKVFSYKLITRGTIEEKMLTLQGVKKELFDSLISSDGASIKSLNENDIEFILGA